MTGIARRLCPAGSGLIIGFSICVVHLASRISQIGDSRMTSMVTWEVLHHGTLDLHDIFRVGAFPTLGDFNKVGSRLLPFFPWPPMLLATPAVLMLSLTDGSAAPWFLSGSNVVAAELPTAAAVVAITALLLRRYRLDLDSSDRGRRIALVVCLTFAFARAGVCWNGTPVSVDVRPGRVWDWSDPQLARPIRDLVAGQPLGQVFDGPCVAPGA